MYVKTIVSAIIPNQEKYIAKDNKLLTQTNNGFKVKYSQLIDDVISCECIHQDFLFL